MEPGVMSSLAELLGQPIVSIKPGHGNDIVKVEDTMGSTGVIRLGGIADVLVTTSEKLVLCFRAADCAIFAIEATLPDGTIVRTLGHSGQQGAFAKSSTISAAIEWLLERGAALDSFRIKMGPSICPDCYGEVDVLKKLIFDAFAFGLTYNQVEASRVCTKCGDKKLHSNRNPHRPSSWGDPDDKTTWRDPRRTAYLFLP